MKNPKDFALILERIKNAEQWRDSCYKDKFERNFKQYHSIPETQREGSNIFVPYTFMQVEVIKARVCESLFAQEPYVTLLPRGDEDADIARTFQTLLNWQFKERIGIAREFAEDITSDALVFGTVIVYTGWKKKDIRRKTKETALVPLPLEDGSGFYIGEDGLPVLLPQQRETETVETVYDDPVCQKIDVFDFFTDPQSTTISDARYCGHVEYLTRGEIEALEESNGWDVDWKNLTPVDNVKGGREIRSGISGTSTQIGETFEKDDKHGLYKIYQYWQDDRHVVIINDEQCALDEANPFWHGMKPYDKCCYIPNSNEFYGISIPDVLHDLQMELNTNRNMRIDYNAMALRRMWKMRKGCGLTPKDLIWRQNGVLQVNELDDVMEISVEKLPASAFGNEEVIKQDMRDATGCHDIIMGLAGSDETATTTMTKDNNASLRFKYFMSALVDDILIPVAEKCISLDQQYMDQSRVVRLVEDDANFILSITPEDLLGNYDIVYVGTSTDHAANKEVYKQKVLETYNLAMGNPLVQASPEAQKELLAEMLSAMEVKNIQDILNAINIPVPQPMPMPQQGVPQNGGMIING